MVKIAHISDIHLRGIARQKEHTRALKILFEDLKEIKPDLIINCGDTAHLKTVLSPELIDIVSWFFNNLADIAPTYHLLGNHDGLLNNLDRQDAISPINNAINNPRSIVLKKSESKIIEVNGKKIALHPYSPFDKEHWDDLNSIDNCINIALFHGAISNALTDTEWDMGHGEKEVSFFNQYDFTLLGDIHKQQFLGYREKEEIINETTLELYKKLYGSSNIEIIEEFEE